MFSSADEQQILVDGMTDAHNRVTARVMAAFDTWWNRVWDAKASLSGGRQGAGASSSSTQSSGGNNNIQHSVHKREGLPDDDDKDEPSRKRKGDPPFQKNGDPEGMDPALHFACPYY